MNFEAMFNQNLTLLKLIKKTFEIPSNLAFSNLSAQKHCSGNLVSNTAGVWCAINRGKGIEILKIYLFHERRRLFIFRGRDLFLVVLCVWLVTLVFWINTALYYNVVFFLSSINSTINKILLASMDSFW